MTVTWTDVVNRIDRTDHRSTRQICGDLFRASARLSRYPLNGDAREQRRIAGCVLREAIAAYRLAGGDPAHLDSLAELIERHRPGDPVRAPVGNRARLARARLELLDERAVAGEDSDVDERIEDIELRASALERHGHWPVTTPGELAAKVEADGGEHDVAGLAYPIGRPGRYPAGPEGDRLAFADLEYTTDD
jgi:hypothetical protein